MDFLQWPLWVRLALLFVAGCCVGGLVNWGIYALAYNARSISPWSRVSAEAPRRRWLDCLPLVGWFRLSRESPLHGRAFWHRPLAVELITGLLFAGLYYWEVDQRGLLPESLIKVLNLPGNERLRREAFVILHWEFLAHAILASFMLVASFIDLDEKTIPDEVTIPGTLVGLALAALVPWSLLPVMILVQDRAAGLDRSLSTLTFSAPNSWPWPGELQGVADPRSLLLGLGCWWLWCVGLMPRVWRTRRGIHTALRIFTARLTREPLTRWLLVMGVVGSLPIAATWRYASGPHWQGLLTGLIGMATGGGMVWIVRIVGRVVMGREAMGFGDVTLMAMIGATLGWQACLYVFFLAPVAGAVIGGLQWLRHRDPEIRFGPFLCLAALVTIWGWATIWERSLPLFDAGWLVPAILGVALLAIGPMLWLVRLIGDLLTGRRNRQD